MMSEEVLILALRQVRLSIESIRQSIDELKEQNIALLRRIEELEQNSSQEANRPVD
jgi:cell division protein FtsB